MAEVVLYAFFLISVNFEDMAWSFPTLAECEEARGKVVLQVEAKSELQGEATYIAPCSQVNLSVRGGRAKK